MHVQNWDDYRYVAVLARTGSLAETSRLLGVDRSTVQRRIRALEHRLGYNLFLRNGARYKALAEAQPILAAARSLESAISPVAAPAAGETIAGNLSITTTDSIYMSGVSEMIDDFQALHPSLRLNLSVTTRRLALDQLESDVAIRPSDSPPDHFVGRRICDLSFGVYSSRAYLQNNPSPRREEHTWLTVSDDMSNSPPGRWIEAHVPADRRVLRADTFIAIAEACRLGRGAALLPKSYAIRLPELVCLDHLMDSPHVTGLWLLTHPDMRNNPRVRAFLDFMGQSLSKKKAHFGG
ncbi:LysR family transcriptional regulator [Hyphomonas sp.]|uniref:LysR family transcriptional regulator n=1 Tax=Hyphomonas sp. TaxID=87 RepID=UPI001DB67192|nr:LysR family transcriptional regulator [Hyphomonas sp.]MBU4060820.1 LysR family transcriptional regulator [Alphaproteobacteria bacterium]MBU4164804.1 LysR family transcriptional regulator [Alphaproteobacteria bacterium]